MAIYDNLPVFKATYDLLLQVVKFSVNMRRDSRYTLGESLKKEILALCIYIYRANLTSEKGPLIEEAREKLVPVKLLVRLLHDTATLDETICHAVRTPGHHIPPADGMAEIYAERKDQDRADAGTRTDARRSGMKR